MQGSKSTPFEPFTIVQENMPRMWQYIGNNEEELNKMFWKVHWDNQNPFLEKCDFCETIFHAETEDLVKKRLYDYESLCQSDE